MVWGERDPWLPAARRRDLRGGLPHAQIEHVQQAGHWPWLDSPDVVDRVASFLQDAA